jgi:exopolysaccharide production protein ExoQ
MPINRQMSKASTHTVEPASPSPSSPIVDNCAIVPIAACIFALIVFPLFIFLSPTQSMSESRLENRIFWPVAATIAIILAVRNRSRGGRLSFPPHIACLIAYLAFAGTSILWAFKPDASFARFVQQLMVVTSIVLPAMLAGPRTDMVRALFLCFAFSSILNGLFVLGGSPEIVRYGSVKVAIGYTGYFTSKNLLGECAAITVLLSLYEMLHPGIRRVFAVVVAVIAIWLVLASDSKTAFGLALMAPVLAGITLIAAKLTRLSPAVFLVSIPILYFVVSTVSNFGMNRIAYILTGDSSFTGRTIIWDFARYKIEQRPLFGWGYQSFWLIGPDAPSVVEAPGWVKMMPNAHNGYYDTMLELGYVGLALLLSFIITTFHAVARVADRDRARGWILLSVALYVILHNFLESLWMRGFDFLWVVFLIVAAEIGRYWVPGRAVHGRKVWRAGSSPHPHGVGRELD